ncbi:MAG TPA: carboxypeptidase-like regulatory domain-containing protein [Gemmatimonadaceae bacterium]|nr:carboxypeptidase-like regulatory domain-containing protein [Gemmatimonadaceae bacterium]
MKTRLRALLACLGGALVAAAVSAPAAAQQSTDIIRGRVTGPDTLPIVRARITATSYQGNISKTAETDRNGRFQIIFINGEGDYWIEVAKIGYNRRRFEIRKVGDEQVMLADARLTSAVVALDAVTITADNRALVNRNARPTDVSGGEKPLTSNSAQVSPDQAGNLAAMAAAAAPGIQRIPGMDGQADMFSAFGLSGDQNNTTFNGLGSGVSALPPDAQVRVTFNQFPADPARGGFSGAQINVMSIPGSNFSFRGLSGYGTGPALQWTDQGADSSGQKSTTLRFGGSLRGPIQTDQSFYNASYSAQRTFADMLTLLNTSPTGLQAAGVAADSASRLLAILRSKGVPVSLDHGPTVRATDNLNYQANIDFTPSSSGTGNSLTLGMFGGYVHVQPTGGNVQTLTRTAAQTGEAHAWSTSASLMHSNYFWFGVLSQTTLGVAIQRQSQAPYLDYPTGAVRVASQLPDGTTSIKNLSFGGGAPPSEVANQAVQLSNQLQWFSVNNKHTIKITSSVSREHNTSDVNASLGTFAFNSLADLEAGVPAAYSRTLSSIHFPSDQVTAAVSIGDAWRPSSKVQVQYGVRFDGNRFLLRPAFNPALRDTFAIRNDVAPNRVNFSPRVGLQWTYGTAPTIAYVPGAARPPLAVIHAVGGIYQNVGSANLLSEAVSQTGLPASTQTISCVGPAAPIPDWSSYSAGPTAAPRACNDGSTGGIFSNAAPSVFAFDRQFDQPRSFRTAADWSSPVLDNRFVLGLQGVFSWNMNQPGVVDMNLDPARGFVLSNEQGRPVFVDPAAIVPTTGTVSITNSRRSVAFRNVALNRSDLHSASRQFVVKVVPVTTNKYRHWDFSYSLLDVRDQFYGFSGVGNTAGNPFDRQWGPHAAEGKHQFTVNWNSIPIADLVYVTIGTTVRSGTLFTPMIAGDVNGDGYLNDRAFIFSPATTADTSLAASIRSLIATGAPAARECLTKQLGQLAERATCQAPWVTTANLRLTLNPQKLRLPKRANISINFTNPLAIADLIAHGSNDTRGWGQDIPPDQNLLFVRGFDPVARQFKYAVNDRFGSTRPQQSASRSAAFVSINVNYDIGFTRERQMLTQRLDAGRGRPGAKANAQTLKAFGTASIPNPMAMILQQPDSLKLTRQQADSLATLSTKFARLADSIWTPAAKALEAEPSEYSHSVAYRRYVVAREQTMDYLISLAPAVRDLLTPAQKRKLPPVILNYLDDRVLKFLRSSSAGDGGNFFIR